MSVEYQLVGISGHHFNQRIKLDRDKSTFGTQQGIHFKLPIGEGIAAQHARITNAKGKIKIEPIAKNVVHVNNQKINRATNLEEGDKITLGRHEYVITDTRSNTAFEADQTILFTRGKPDWVIGLSEDKYGKLIQVVKVNKDTKLNGAPTTSLLNHALQVTRPNLPIVIRGTPSKINEKLFETKPEIPLYPGDVIEKPNFKAVVLPHLQYENENQFRQAYIEGLSKEPAHSTLEFTPVAADDLADQVIYHLRAFTRELRQAGLTDKHIADVLKIAHDTQPGENKTAAPGGYSKFILNVNNLMRQIAIKNPLKKSAILDLKRKLTQATNLYANANLGQGDNNKRNRPAEELNEIDADAYLDSTKPFIIRQGRRAKFTTKAVPYIGHLTEWQWSDNSNKLSKLDEFAQSAISTYSAIQVAKHSTFNVINLAKKLTS